MHSCDSTLAPTASLTTKPRLCPILQGARNKDGIDKEGGEAKLNQAVAALDKVVALVPDGMVSKAQQIVDELEAQVQAEREEMAAEQAQQLQQKLEGLL